MDRALRGTGAAFARGFEVKSRLIVVAAMVCGLGVAGVCAAPWASATTHANGYFITVSPTAQDPGKKVTVTGEGQIVVPGFSEDNCDSTTISATVSWVTASGTEKTETVTLGESDGDGNITAQVTIPADAGPTAVTGKSVTIQAFCDQDGDIFLSQLVSVHVNGSAPTTTTAAPTTTVVTVPAAAPVTAAAVTTTTAAPATQLPRTGSSSGPLAILGATLLATGGALVLSRRRRLHA
jgi:LPXTG-motif cell wall-anchored protein